MKRSLKGLLVSVLTVSLLTIGAALAYAHSWTENAQVTIDYDNEGQHFEGRVKSDRNVCERNREVEVRKIKPTEDRVVGTDRTNDNGRYRVPDDNPHGDFYAKVFRKERSGGDHVCRGERSDPIPIG
jgi:hypothetical protein